jgi:hypothetical protein
VLRAFYAEFEPSNKNFSACHVRAALALALHVGFLMRNFARPDEFPLSIAALVRISRPLRNFVVKNAWIFSGAVHRARSGPEQSIERALA